MTWRLDSSGKLLLNASGQIATECGGDVAIPYRDCSDNTILMSGGGEVVASGPTCAIPFRVYHTLSGYPGDCFYSDPADCRPVDPSDVAIIATGQYTSCTCSTFFFQSTPVRRCSDNSVLTSGGLTVVSGICVAGTTYFKLSGYGDECFYVVGSECRNFAAGDTTAPAATIYTDCTCATLELP